MKKAPFIAAAAILGLGVGVGLGYQLRAPEADYPACYKQTVDAGFNTLDGIQYTLQQKQMTDGNLTLALHTNVLCPYQVDVKLYGNTGKGFGVVGTKTILADKGQLQVLFPKPEKLTDDKLFLAITPALEQTAESFLNLPVVPEVIKFSTTMVAL